MTRQQQNQVDWAESSSHVASSISTGGSNREPRTVVTRMLAEFWPSLITSLGIERRSGKVRGRAARPPNVRDDREREVLFL
ncbi:hypothetical protein NL676_018235 [Syzygium grande]|nr:hypothetical protein NL676_018235 [Syzygium grande]